ncbi:MAG: hypothetical protein ACXADC_02870 [Candidatus Thorarchaeota archaeon]|jgi:hypothetical protein
MTESSSPEDRLRKYKEFISGLQLANHRDPGKSSPASNSVSSESKKPVKKELITALAVLKQSKEKDSAVSKEQDVKKNVMLRIKEKALDSSMLEIRDEKRRLERKLEKGEISKAEYEAEIQKLVRKGQSVLKAKSIVAEEKNGFA